MKNNYLNKQICTTAWGKVATRVVMFLLPFALAFANIGSAAADGTYTVVGVTVTNTNDYDVYWNAQFETNNNNAWYNGQMTKAGLTFEGKKLYIGSFTDWYNGTANLQFLIKNGEFQTDWMSAHSSWNSVGAYNQQIFNATDDGTSHNGSWYSKLSMNAGAKLYFDATGWTSASDKYKMCIGHANYQKYYTLTAVPNTKLYYGTITSGHNWTDAMGFGVVANTTADNGQNWLTDVSAKATEYTGFLHYELSNTNDKHAYLLVNAGNAGQQPTASHNDDYISLNSTQTIKCYVKSAGSSDFVLHTAPATINITSYELTAQGSTTERSVTITTSTSSNTVSAARTAKTTLVAPVVAGYTFNGWYSAGGTLLSAETTYIYYPTEATEIHARYTENAYTITISATAGGSVNVSSVQAGVYTQPEITATASVGYEFDGWTCTDGASVADASSTTTTVSATAIGTVTAIFKRSAETTHDVTIAYMCGSNDLSSLITNPTTSLTVGEETALNISAPAITGYTFSNWSYPTDIHATGTDPISFTAHADNLTLTANYTENTYSTTISYKAGGTTLTPTTPISISQITQVTPVTLTAPTIENYTFTGWTLPNGITLKSGEANSTTISVVATQVSTIVANYTETLHTVTIQRKYGETLLEEATQQVGAVTTVSVEASPIYGYTFSSWTDLGATTLKENVVSDANIGVTTTTPTTIIANYTEDLTTTWELRGNQWNDWGAANPFVKATGHSPEKIATVTVTLTAGQDYYFGVYNTANSTLYKNSNKMTHDNCTNWPFTTGADNCCLYAPVDGEYTFTIDFSGTDPYVSVTFPENAISYYLKGDFTDNWSTGYRLIKGEGNTAYCELDLEKSRTYEFKIFSDDNGKAYGINSNNTATYDNRTINYVQEWANKNGNLKLQTAAAGIYRITVTFNAYEGENAGKKKIDITYPEATKVSALTVANKTDAMYNIVAGDGTENDPYQVVYGGELTLTVTPTLTGEGDINNVKYSYRRNSQNIAGNTSTLTYPVNDCEKHYITAVANYDDNGMPNYTASRVYYQGVVAYELSLTNTNEVIIGDPQSVTCSAKSLTGFTFLIPTQWSFYKSDNTPIVENATDATQIVSTATAGDHQIYAVVKNADGIVLGKTETLTYTVANAKYIYFKKDWNALYLFKQGDQGNSWPGSNITSTSTSVFQIVNGETAEYYKVRVDNTWGWFILNNNNNGSQTGNIAPANVEANHHYKYSGNKLLPDDEDDMCVFYVITDDTYWTGSDIYYAERANGGNNNLSFQTFGGEHITMSDCVYPISIHKGSEFNLNNNNNTGDWSKRMIDWKSYDNAKGMKNKYYRLKYNGTDDVNKTYKYIYEEITFSLGLSSTPNIPASGNTITLTLTPLSTTPTSILDKLVSCLSYKYYVSFNGAEYDEFIPEGNSNTKTYTLPNGTLQENDRYSFKVEACAGDRVLATTEPVVVTVEATQKTFYFINNKKWDAVYLTRSSHKQPGKYIYTLVGDQTWLSKSWDNNNVDAEMYCTAAPTVDEAAGTKTYTFTRTRKNVKLKQGDTYNCKVITGHDWDGYQYPGNGTSSNYAYMHNGETGYYDLTFTFIVTENNEGNNETEVISVAENPLTVTATRCTDQDAAAAEGAYTIAGAVQVHQDAARCDLYKIDIFHGETFYLTDTKGKQKTAKEQFTDVNHYQVYRYSLDNKKLVDIDMQVSPQSTVVNNAVTLKANVPDANECIKYKFYCRQGTIDKTATYTAINNEPLTAISALHTPSATGKWSYKMEVYTKNSAGEFVLSTTDYEEIDVQESTDITFFFHNVGYDSNNDGIYDVTPWDKVGLYVWKTGESDQNAKLPGIEMVEQIGGGLYEITIPKDVKFIINNFVGDPEGQDYCADKRQTVEIHSLVQQKISDQDATIAPNIENGKVYKLVQEVSVTKDGNDDGKRYTLQLDDNEEHVFYRVRTVNSQGIYFSNWVANTGTTEGGNRISGDTLSFFVEKGGKIEVYNNAGVLVKAGVTYTTGESGVKTAVLNANKEVTEIAAYPREWGYFINVDAAKDQRGYQMNWAEMSPEAAADAKFTYFPPNDNYPNEYFNHYWVRFIDKAYCVNATVGNRFNGSLSDAIIPETETSKTNKYGYPTEHANVRFGYHDETNKFTRVFLTGAPLKENIEQLTANNNVFLRLYGDNIYYDDNRTNKIDKLEAFKTDKVNNIALASNRFKDMSNWTYEFEGYADPNSSVKIIAAYPNTTALTSFFGQDELGEYYSKEVLSEDATVLAKPIKIRFIYDFKTNRLITAWNPQDAEIDKAITIDAPMMITREQGVDDASTTTTTVSLIQPAGSDRYGSVNDLKQVYATFEISKAAFQSNQTGKMFWMSLPFDCRVGDVFGLDGYGGTEGKKWVIQRYGGDWRAHYGYQSWIETFWMNLDETYNTSTSKYEDHILPAGEGFVLNLFGVTADDFKEGADGQSILRIYFPSTSSKSWNLTMSSDGWTKEYPRMICKVDGRKKYDSNWRVIGVLGYDDITMKKINPSIVEEEDGDGNTWVYDENFSYYYAWSWDTDKHEGVYTPTTWEIGTSMRTMYGYMAQFAGTINWSRLANTEDLPASVRARDRREFQGGRVRIDLMQGDNSLDRTYIQLVEGATAEFDENIDLNKVAKPDSYIYTYGTDLESILPTDWRPYYADQSGNPIGTGTTLWDMQAYAANCLPVEDAIIPLAVNVKTEGSYTFKAQSVPEGMICILHDTVANLRVNMALDSYTVDNLQVGDITDRFAIEITIAETPSIPDNLENANAETIHYWQQDGSLYFSGLNANEHFVLYDMVGHIIYSGNYQLGQAIPAPQTGMYLFSTHTATVKITVR